MTNKNGFLTRDEIYELARLYVIRPQKNDNFQRLIREFFNMQADMEQMNTFVEMIQDEKVDLEDKVLDLSKQNKKLGDEVDRLEQELRQARFGVTNSPAATNDMADFWNSESPNPVDDNTSIRGTD